jgi:hypothetical protein
MFEVEIHYLTEPARWNPTADVRSRGNFRGGYSLYPETLTELPNGDCVYSPVWDEEKAAAALRRLSDEELKIALLHQPDLHKLILEALQANAIVRGTMNMVKALGVGIVLFGIYYFTTLQ